ncbi:hypothetical protein [Mycobacterium sp. E1747]|uniref:hypothetical protein n=1 Tax=Mycobacterium sp. E1747 TaxID=1834128 RepID=UPI0012EA95DF|nr:hypothetical protein [Mycobacterium sp. E1747]
MAVLGGMNVVDLGQSMAATTSGAATYIAPVPVWMIPTMISVARTNRMGGDLS